MKWNWILLFWRSRSKYEKTLFWLFLLGLPFLHLVVNGDGIGYYAYIRSPLIDHNLSFSSDWRDPGEELEKIFAGNYFIANPVTKTGHLPNFYAVGPAILWSPFLIVTHWAVLGLNHLGWHIVADGHSWPYLAAMAGSTALYGFAGLCLSFATARRFVEERWAFWATVGMWFGTALPVYLYLLPAWSHAHAVFTTALFLWYWVRTRGTRTSAQWLKLGLLTGLMIDVYQLSGAFCLAVAYEALSTYWEAWRTGDDRIQRLAKAVRLHALYAVGTLLALLPTFVARQIVFGGPFDVGPYSLRYWNWTGPALVQVLFSKEHGLFVFTPIVVLAIIGLFCTRRLDRALGTICLLTCAFFYVAIAFLPWWHGGVGLGNRYFVPLTPIFTLGLASLCAWAARFWTDARAASFRVIPLTLLFVVWNLGLVYQWQTHLIPRYGLVNWDELLFNQFRVVPGAALHDFAERFHLEGHPSN